MDKNKERCPESDKECVHRDTDNGCTLLFNIDFDGGNHPCPFRRTPEEREESRRKTLRRLVEAGREDLIRKHSRELLGGHVSSASDPGGENDA